MIKLYVGIVKRPDISVEQFHTHWGTVHADFGRRITDMTRYVQAHRLPEQDIDMPAPPFEGIAEGWFADLATVAALGENPQYTQGAQLDERNFMVPEQMAFLMTTEQVLEAGPDLAIDTPTHKLIQLVRRPEGAELDQWQKAAAAETDLAGALGAQRHVVSLCLPEMYGEVAPPYDGVRELVWSDRDSYLRGRKGAPEAWARLTDPTLVDPDASRGLLVEEKRVTWPQ